MTRDARRKQFRPAWLGSAMLFVALCQVPACATSGASRAARVVPDARPSVAPDRGSIPRQRLTDADIQLAVVRRLEHASALPAPRVQVSVMNGIVSLVGRVNRGEERLRAAELAEQTRGVRAVVNRLVVEPGWVPRSDLAQEIRASLLQESEEEFANVTVTAEGSRVRLGGSVPRARSKEMAERAAWYVAGVIYVDNQIRVRPKFVRSDHEIADDVIRSLRADPYVGSAPLSVSVKEGHVRLSGAVQSMFERRRARERALLAGVVEVDDQAVRVLPESVPVAGYVRAPSTDHDVALAIRDAFRADPRIPEQSIDFQVSYGVVTLTGWVSTLAQKLAAAEDARNAVGTWAVLNGLEVRPEGGLPPRGLDQQVIARLREHPSVNAKRIRVAAEGGAVVLEGAVSSMFEQTTAERSAAGVPGVTSIENRLEIRPSREIERSDAEIEADIERELWWDPRVGNVKVEVTVEAGVVTLRGEVANAEVYDAVLENAFQAQPRRLVNELWRRQPARFLYSD
jgi:osmotically-inducible protein OsmY